VVEFRDEAERICQYRRRPDLLVSFKCLKHRRRKGKALGRIALEDDLVAERLNWKKKGSRVVLVYGAFDLLHPGHIRLLEQAKSLGNVLIVAVESDASIRSANTADLAYRGQLQREALRPVTPAAERVEILAALAAVDYVVELGPVALPDLVGRLLPDVLVTGAAVHESGQTNADIGTEEIVKLAGGVVTAIPPEPGYSTSSLMDRIRQLRA
jgi:rfaE bifunctional protein nucleotidyltransferase chain/domain